MKIIRDKAQYAFAIRAQTSGREMKNNDRKGKNCFRCLFYVRNEVN